jgi:hypothetical protein
MPLQIAPPHRAKAKAGRLSGSIHWAATCYLKVNMGGMFLLRLKFLGKNFSSRILLPGRLRCATVVC